MVTKGYQKGVYEWVTKGTGRRDRRVAVFCGKKGSIASEQNAGKPNTALGFFMRVSGTTQALPYPLTSAMTCSG